MSRTKLTMLTLATGSAALLLALAGCSAAAGETDTKGGSGSSSAESHDAKFQEWELKMAQCFRDKGLDVEDPTPEGGWADVTAEMQEVSPECQAEVGEPPVRQLSEAEKKAGEQARFEYDTKFGDCMRELGYDIADAKLGGLSLEVPADAATADLETCSTQATQ